MRPSRQFSFLIVAPGYTHRSAGVRALYRLCHHLNRAGYPAAVVNWPGRSARDVLRRSLHLIGNGASAMLRGGSRDRKLAFQELRDTGYRFARRVWRQAGPPDLSPWDVPGYRGPLRDAVVIYPEIVSGNPLRARKVVRWVLNSPGLLGGDAFYADSEMVFAYDPQKLPAINEAVHQRIGAERVLWMGLVDPAHIYPDPTVPKVLDCSFTNKGRLLSHRFPLDPGLPIHRLEDLTPTMAALGDTLRRTRTLHSFDHYSNVLREAAISGCAVRVPDAQGIWHDPEGCDCPLNIRWTPGFRDTYAADFHDGSFVRGFIEQLETRWPIPAADSDWVARPTPRAG
ncbi:MAG: hypothetical protein WCK73_13785 [Deltaproteobacteria bacterium]